MQFINALLLFGLLAIAVPIIIQLLSRKNHRITPWGAMIFLMAAMRKRKRKVLLEDILLLACRCLLPAFAALALARPFSTPDSQVAWVLVLPALLLAVTLFGISFALWRYPKWRALCMAASIAIGALVAAATLFEKQLNLKRFGGGASKDVALVVDASSSMCMVGPDGKSNFELAVEEAGKYLEQAGRQTAFSVILGGPVPEVKNPVPVSDRRVLRETLQELRPAHGTMNAPAALAAAAVTLSSGNNAVKQIVVLGDGQAVGWDLQSKGRWNTIKSVFSQMRTPPPLVWRTLPLPASIRDVAASGISLSRDVVGTDREVAVRVSVLNAGTEAVTPDSVTLRAGSQVYTTKDVRQLEPGATQVFEFRHKFDKPGATVLSATVSARDDLPEDDTFRFVVPVLDSVRALVVDGDSSGPRLARGSTYVSLALRPQNAGSAADRAGFLLATEVEDVARAATRTDFSSYALVALCNVAQLSEQTLAALAAYVRGGGGLMVLPGAKARAPLWNAWRLRGEPVLPMELGAWKTLADPAEASPLDPASFSHDALRSFRAGSDLGRVAPLQKWTLRPGLAGATGVAASFADGSPALAIRSFGRGSVVLSAFPFEAIASDLPSRKSFVPFVHELAYLLASPLQPELNVAPSDGAQLLLAPRVAASSLRGGGSRGLLGYYYPQKKQQGEPKIRTDATVDFNWGGGPPMAGGPADNFSVRWVGSISVPADGAYEFQAAADDRCSISIDGKAYGGGALALKKGQKLNVRLDYEEDGGMAQCSFRWKTPGAQAFAAVPSEVLSPVSAAGFGQLVSVADPNGALFNAELLSDAEGTWLKVSRPLLPGLYAVQTPEGGLPPGLGAAVSADGTIPFAVRAGTEESEMLAVSKDQEDFLRGYVQLSLATKEEDVVKILHGNAFGREMWRFFAIAALIFLVAEIALARWISIQRRSGEETDVDFTNEGEMGKASFKDALKKLKGR
ncbi:MAG: BatA domain-containing protein [Kiritimatiellae bacterium]|nr:BatA domain-containing protein [Kiritimatiellia bacterium]